MANRFPVKPIWDGLSLGRLALTRDLSMEQKRACFRFYMAKPQIDNLMVSLTRSGSHWSLLGMTLARDLANGGTGSFHHNGKAFIADCGYAYTKLDWRVPAGLPIHDFKIVEPMLFHSHHPYFRIRQRHVRDMKVVILLRDIVGSMESKYYKIAETPDHPNELDRQQFAWETLLEDAIEFYNSWGDMKQILPRCKLMRYEDLLADTVGAHEEMADFWELNIPRWCIEKSFASITKENMRKVLVASGVEKQTEVSFRGESEGLPAEQVAYIRQRLAKEVVHDFGYGYQNVE